VFGDRIGSTVALREVTRMLALAAAPTGQLLPRSFALLRAADTCGYTAGTRLVHVLLLMMVLSVLCRFRLDGDQ
jgi:hypothetical protein